MLPDAQHLGDERLNLGRILRRRMHDHLALLARIRDRRLRFEIKLLLPAAGECAAQSVRRGGELRIDIAATDSPTRAQKLLATNRFGQIQDRLSRPAFDANRLAPFLQRGLRLSAATTATGWPKYSTFAVGQKRLVHHDDAEHIVAGNIGDRVASDDARNRQRGARIDAQQLAGRNRTADETDVQLAGHRAQVVDVRRLARDMAERGIVRY